ncbi:TrmH family RNA methyltransferase [Patiriisocius sp. Uisw_017]|uniref:TrmH family RNA methyltransferase n=1 Tax=Patiriisocius sp. Uisw_017 TaxID=3230968 RepID=UPI0039E7620A
MISKSQIKLITSLHQKKHRNNSGLFVAEGPKVIAELISENLVLHSLFTTEKVNSSNENYYSISKEELQKISFLKTANTSLALFKIPESFAKNKNGITVALDAVRDPGNLGTIIRLCDWFGVSQLVCSEDTVDCYNPKVIQATMGSIARVAIFYTSLNKYLKESSSPIFAAMMEGDIVYKSKLPNDAILLMGNEANGVSKEVLKLATHAISIPQFGKGNPTESLNVATATAILLSEFKRFTER